jgi:hypothetical protein
MQKIQTIENHALPWRRNDFLPGVHRDRFIVPAARTKTRRVDSWFKNHANADSILGSGNLPHSRAFGRARECRQKRANKKDSTIA